MSTVLSSYWKVFRLVFVIFFLYLLGDAFYRWDGFKYYASFSEFLPNLCLVSILWCIVAVLTAFLIWLPIRVISFFCRHLKWNNAQRIFLFVYLLVSLGAVIFIIKRIVWFGAPVPLYVKLIIILGGSLAAIFIDWLLRNKFELIQGRITPLVWLFGLFVVMSVLIRCYFTIWEQTSKKISPELSLSSGTNMNRPNIILITFDALTTRDMSVYGYYRPTTPFLSEWAKKASLFSGVKAASNWTATSLSSLMTGKRVWTHRVFQPHAYNIYKGGTENLPKVLKENGYYNLAYISNMFVPFTRNGIDEYFDIFYNPTIFAKEISILGHIDLKLYEFFGDKCLLYDWIIKEDFIFGKFLYFVSSQLFKGNQAGKYFSLEKVFNKFLQDIDKNPPEPFFAWMHVWQPHGPYLPPEPYEGMFGPVTDNTYTNRDRYDELIRYCDEQFKIFINALTISEKLKNTVIILSSDHGESFEHDYVTHGGLYLYEQVTSIPLIIKEPGQGKGIVIDDIVEQRDISATILDLANIPFPSWMNVRSLVPLMRGKKLEAKPVFSMNFENNPSNDEITKGVIAVWQDDYKLILNLEGKRHLLFNLKKDPDELNNIYDKEIGVGQSMLKLIHDGLEKANRELLYSSRH